MKEPKQPAPEDLVKEFRAYLHLVITAGQSGRGKALDSLPGPRMAAYCRELAKMPGNTLAGELAEPVRAILKLIHDVTIHFYRPIHQKKVKDAAEQAELEKILEQLDFALALIMRHLPGMVRYRLHLTRSIDLLVEAMREMIIGRAGGIERVLRHHKELVPEEYEQPEVNFHSESNYLFQFAWDTYERIEVLGRLAEEFPEHIRAAARRMHGWPMLMHRHTNNRRQFEELAKKLELGAEYPTDASAGARFRPDTPLVRYLDPLIRRIHIVCEELGDIELKTTEDERRMLLHLWWWRLDESPNDEELAALRAARKLPPLTKTTAIEWAEKAFVPLILATDAKDWKNCKVPVLQRISKQGGVKSRATFKSRLLAAVTATLRRLARST